AHYDDATHRLAIAIQLRDTTAHVGSELYIRNVAEQNWNAARACADRNFFQIFDRVDVSANAQNKFFLRHLNRAATHFAVTLFDRAAHVANGEVVRTQLGRIDSHLVLLHESANRGDLCHALD